MPLSDSEREWVRQQALQQATEAEAKKRMAKAVPSRGNQFMTRDEFARHLKDTVEGVQAELSCLPDLSRLRRDQVQGLIDAFIAPLQAQQSPSQLILDHDRQFLAQLKIQADF